MSGGTGPGEDSGAPATRGATSDAAAAVAGASASAGPDSEPTRPARLARQLSRAVPILIVVALVVAIVATIIALLNGGDDDSDLSRADVGGVTQSAPTTTADGLTATSAATTTGVGASDAPDGWVVFTDPDGSFTASLPATPNVSSEEVLLAGVPVTRREYTVPVGASRSVVIGITPGIVPAGTGSAFLRAAAQDAAQGLGGTLEVSADPVDEGAAPRLDFTVAYPGGLMRARGLVVGTTLHLLTVVVREPDADPVRSASLVEGVFDNYLAAA